MDKNEAIETILDLYPADSQYRNSATVGKQLLMQAICESWQSLPKEVLVRYAQLCIEKESE